MHRSAKFFCVKLLLVLLKGVRKKFRLSGWIRKRALLGYTFEIERLQQNTTTTTTTTQCTTFYIAAADVSNTTTPRANQRNLISLSS